MGKNRFSCTYRYLTYLSRVVRPDSCRLHPVTGISASGDNPVEMDTLLRVLPSLKNAGGRVVRMNPGSPVLPLVNPLFIAGSLLALTKNYTYLQHVSHHR
jgi:hypothetical protein